jgi:oligosaccharyltransferase complex subunit delta (ribophorin II)
MLSVICEIITQKLKFDPENGVHFLDVLPKSVDVGSYQFVFEVILSF